MRRQPVGEASGGGVGAPPYLRLTESIRLEGVAINGVLLYVTNALLCNE